LIESQKTVVRYIVDWTVWRCVRAYTSVRAHVFVYEDNTQRPAYSTISFEVKQP